MKEIVPIKYLGFEPTDQIRRRALDAWDAIERIAPSDATVMLTVENFEGKYIACCRVVSVVSTMFCEKAHSNPFKALEKLEEGTRRKINKWKRNRKHVFVSPYHQIA